MIKSRNAISSVKITKRPIRPISATTSHSKNPRISHQIHQIISNLEQNVKDLKTHYNCRDDSKRTTISNQKNKTGFRVGKVLHRNRSQSNFKKPQSDKIQDRSIMDIFQIRSCFLKLNGRESNNIVELYEFYKKNMQKREKSTRILASIDMSNPNMGFSLEVGKESMLKHQHVNFKEQNKQQQKDSPKIDEKLESSSKFNASGKINGSALQKGSKKLQKPSLLASQLMSKNLYNFNNIANLMSNKKYKLTKDKEESFRIANQHKQKIASAKLHLSKENNHNLINSMQQRTENEMMLQIKQMKEVMMNKNSPKLPLIQAENKKEIEEEVSFKNKNLPQKQTINLPEIQLRSEKKQEKSDLKSFQVSSIKKQGNDAIKIQNIIGLEQSPIVASKTNDFIKSKYYVQPIPMLKKDKNLLQQESLSLKSNSRIIDLQLLPFDL